MLNGRNARNLASLAVATLSLASCTRSDQTGNSLPERNTETSASGSGATSLVADGQREQAAVLDHKALSEQLAGLKHTELQAATKHYKEIIRLNSLDQADPEIRKLRKIADDELAEVQLSGCKAAWKIVEADLTSELACDAAIWIVQTSARYDHDGLIRALEFLTQHHASSPWRGIGETCHMFTELSPDSKLYKPASNFYEAVSNSPHAINRAQVRVILAERAFEAYRQADHKRSDQTDALAERALRLFEELRKEPYALQPYLIEGQDAALADHASTYITELTHLRRGKAAPEIGGESIEGGSLSAADFRGRTVVAFVWSSTCVPCHERAEELKALIQTVPFKDVKVLGVNIDEDRKAASSAQEKQKLPWLSIADGRPDGKAGPVAKALNIQKIPRILVIDKKGILRAIDPESNELKQALLDSEAELGK